MKESLSKVDDIIVRYSKSLAELAVSQAKTVYYSGKTEKSLPYDLN
jgi:hypothetical protein